MDGVVRTRNYHENPNKKEIVFLSINFYLSLLPHPMARRISTWSLTCQKSPSSIIIDIVTSTRRRNGIKISTIVLFSSLAHLSTRHSPCAPCLHKPHTSPWNIIIMAQYQENRQWPYHSSCSAIYIFSDGKRLVYWVSAKTLRLGVAESGDRSLRWHIEGRSGTWETSRDMVDGLHPQAVSIV